MTERFLARGCDMVPEACDDPCESISLNPRRKRESFLTDAGFTCLRQMLDELSGKLVDAERPQPAEGPVKHSRPPKRALTAIPATASHILLVASAPPRKFRQPPC